MAKPTNKFKPYVGRCFELKNYTTIKNYPPIILVMDETKKEVMFLDNNGHATWILKFYLRDTPIESRVFSTADTLTNTMTLLEKMRSDLVEILGKDPLDTEKYKASKELNKRVSQCLQELRDLGVRMKGVQFAGPEEPEVDEPSEE